MPPRPRARPPSCAPRYRDASLTPDAVGLLEAHGTDTVSGERVEIAAARRPSPLSGPGRSIAPSARSRRTSATPWPPPGSPRSSRPPLAREHGIIPSQAGFDTPPDTGARRCSASGSLSVVLHLSKLALPIYASCFQSRDMPRIHMQVPRYLYACSTKRQDTASQEPRVEAIGPITRRRFLLVPRPVSEDSISRRTFCSARPRRQSPRSVRGRASWRRSILSSGDPDVGHRRRPEGRASAYCVKPARCRQPCVRDLGLAEVQPCQAG